MSPEIERRTIRKISWQLRPLIAAIDLTIVTASYGITIFLPPILKRLKLAD